MGHRIKGTPGNLWHYSWITILLVTPAILLMDFAYRRVWTGDAGWELAPGVIVAAAAVSLVVALFVVLIVSRERQHLNNRLHEHSTTDELTRLKNRRGFFALAEQQLRLARRNNEPLCLFYADVDDFKVINEKLGHREGDRVLKEVAQTLNACYRETDIIARFGGDEFLVLPVGMLPDEANLFIDRFNRAFERVQWHGKDAPATVSFGLAVFDPKEAATLDELISEAGTSLRPAATPGQAAHRAQPESDAADKGPGVRGARSPG